MSTLKRNFIYVLLQQFILIGLPFLTIPYISRVLGPDGVGLYSYSFSIITLFINVFLLGSNLYAVREIAKVKDDERQLSKVFSEIHLFRTMLLAVAFIVYLLGVMLFFDNNLIFYLQLLHLVGAFFDITWLFQGLENFKKVVTRNIVLKLLGFASVFIFVKDKEDLFLYTIIMGSSVIIGNLALFYRLKKHVSFTFSVSKEGMLLHVRPMLILFIPSMAAMLYSVMDKMLLGSLSTTTQVGYYEQSYKIVFMISSLINISGTVMLPRTSALIANGNFEKLLDVLRKGITFTAFLVLPITFGFSVIAEEFVIWFLGDAFKPSALIALIMAPIIVFKSLGVIFGSWYLVPMEKNKEYTLPIVFGAVLSIVLNVILIPIYGAIGAAIATVMTEGLIVGIQVWFLRNELNLKQLTKGVLIKYLLISMIMAALTYPISMLITVPDFVDMVIKIIAGILIYAGILLLIKDQLAVQFFKKIPNIKNKNNASNV